MNTNIQKHVVKLYFMMLTTQVISCRYVCVFAYTWHSLTLIYCEVDALSALGLLHKVLNRH